MNTGKTQKTKKETNENAKIEKYSIWNETVSQQTYQQDWTLQNWPVILQMGHKKLSKLNHRKDFVKCETKAAFMKCETKQEL